MKMTLQEKANMLNIQYVLEYLIEHYNEAKYESDKYKIKLLLFDFIKETEVTIKQIKDYMKLDEDKFEPFIKVLENIKETRTKAGQMTKETESSFDMSAPQGICLYIRR